MLTTRVVKKFPSLVVRQLRCKSSMSPQTTSLWDAPQEFWGSLRRQAAQALTSSLSPAEQQDLLTKLGYRKAPEAHASTTKVEKQEEDTLFVQKSIEEAVAEARLQEVAMQSKKFEKEREKLMQDAEKAAQQQMETELRIQKFQKWQNDVQQARTLASMETNSAQETATALETSESDDSHPILGHPVVDMGYKRVHVVSAKQLATIRVWKKQRIYRHNRSETMAQDKLKTLHLGMPGIIGLYEVSSYDI